MVNPVTAKPGRFLKRPICTSNNQGKDKHININKFAGLSRDWAGGKILFMCFFRVIPYGGEKTHKQNSPKIPAQSRENIVYVFFSLCVFFRCPNTTTGKSHQWTNTSVGGDFRQTFRTIGPYEFPQEKIWTNDWSI